MTKCLILLSAEANSKATYATANSKATYATYCEAFRIRIDVTRTTQISSSSTTPLMGELVSSMYTDLLFTGSIFFFRFVDTKVEL